MNNAVHQSTMLVGGVSDSQNCRVHNHMTHHVMYKISVSPITLAISYHTSHNHITHRVMYKISVSPITPAISHVLAQSISTAGTLSPHISFVFWRYTVSQDSSCLRPQSLLADVTLPK